MKESATLAISPKYDASHWSALDLDNDADWPRAVDILRDRLNGRFIGFIDELLKEEYSGFVALALDAMVVETLQQFRDGVVKNSKGGSEAAFIRFLTETSFKEDFDETMARRFYKDVRCGILHQAEAMNLTRIRRDGTRVVDPLPSGNGFTIHPVMFHKRLKQVFSEYCQALLDPANAELRKRFRTKMNTICDVRKARGEVFVG